MVNHSEEFVLAEDPQVHIHKTLNIVGGGGEFKAHLKYYRGTSEDLLPQHLDGFIYRKAYLNENVTQDLYMTFLSHMAVIGYDY